MEVFPMGEAGFFLFHQLLCHVGRLWIITGCYAYLSRRQKNKDIKKTAAKTSY